MSETEIRKLEARQQQLAEQRRAAEERVKTLKAQRAQQILAGDIGAAEEADGEIQKAERETELLSIAGDSAFASLRRARATHFRQHAEGVMARLTATQEKLGALIRKHVNALRAEAGGVFDDLRRLPEECMAATGMGYPVADERFLGSLDSVLSTAIIRAFAGDGGAVDIGPIREGLRCMITRARDAENKAAESEADAAQRAARYGDSREQRPGSIVVTRPAVM